MSLDPHDDLLAPSGSTGSAAGETGRGSDALQARSKLAAGLAVLACVGCCAVPVLVPLGVLGGGAVAAAATGLTVVAGMLFAVAVLLWVLHRRTKQRAVAQHGCGDACGCGG